MKKILYIDMDNVLVDFTSAFPKLEEEVCHQNSEGRNTNQTERNELKVEENRIPRDI